MKYYYVKNGQQAGPVEESELIGLGVTQDTLVWCNGMAEWTKAGKVSALAYLFATPSHPVEESAAYSNGQPNAGVTSTYPVSAKWLVFSILAICWCSFFGIPGIIWWARARAKYNQGKYEEAANAAYVSQKWAKIGFWIGLAQLIIYIIIEIIAIGTASSYSYYY